MIEVVGLRKNFGRTEVLKGLDPGTPARYMLPGPNGSGKTTHIAGCCWGCCVQTAAAWRARDGPVAPTRRAPSTSRPRPRRCQPLAQPLSGGEVIDLLGRLRGDRPRQEGPLLIARST